MKWLLTVNQWNPQICYKTARIQNVLFPHAFPVIFSPTLLILLSFSTLVFYGMSRVRWSRSLILYPVVYHPSCGGTMDSSNLFNNPVLDWYPAHRWDNIYRVFTAIAQSTRGETVWFTCAEWQQSVSGKQTKGTLRQ